MPFETIIVKKEDHIATIVLNRPERLNAVNDQMVQELLAAVQDVTKDAEARVLVITGAGRGFCAGADVARMPGGDARKEQTAEEFREQLKSGHIS